jgi:CheY-like chemotaxis protein
MTVAITILVVDDNPPMARTTADILTAKGYKALTAHSGREALDILRREPVDILLTDVIMPGMDGVTLYRQARQIHPRLFTVLMTAYSADELIQQGIAQGIKTVLTKPVDVDLLLSLVRAFEHTYLDSQT